MNNLKQVIDNYQQFSRISKLMVPEKIQEFMDESGISYLEFVVYEKNKDDYIEIYRDPNRLIITDSFLIDFEKGYEIHSKIERQVIIIAEFPKIKSYIIVTNQSIINDNDLTSHLVTLDKDTQLINNTTITDELQFVSLD